MAEFTDKPGYAFGDGPPAAVSDFLRRKENRPSWGFREVEPEEHAVAFTVAKSAGFDILDDVREELQRAIDGGLTFEQFRKNLKPRLVAKGWWGRAVVEGPDGKQEVQLGSTRRLRTIYRANLRSARAAGQWERIERTKRALPYLLYQLGPSERHRPHHESKAGWVLPADDPFWAEWFPPNGWGCKCWVRQIGRAEAERRGIVDQVNIPRRDVRNPATGEVRNLPAGLDPAWAGNPGLTRLRNAEAFLEGKLIAASPEAQRVAARDIAGSWRARRIHEEAGPRDLGSVPVAVIGEAAAARLGATTRVVRYGGASQPEKMRRKHPEATPEMLAWLDAALSAGEVFEEGGGDGPRGLTAFLAIDGALWLFAIKRPAARDDELWVSTWHRSNADQLDRARRGARRRGR